MQKVQRSVGIESEIFGPVRSAEPGDLHKALGNVARVGTASMQARMATQWAYRSGCCRDEEERQNLACNRSFGHL